MCIGYEARPTPLTKSQTIYKTMEKYLKNKSHTLNAECKNDWMIASSELVSMINDELLLTKMTVSYNRMQQYNPIQEIPAFIIPTFICEMLTDDVWINTEDIETTLKRIIIAIDPRKTMRGVKTIVKEILEIRQEQTKNKE